MEFAKQWTLHTVDGDHDLSDHPLSLREAVLLAATHCSQTAGALKKGVVSLADPQSLSQKFQFVGVDGSQRITISSDEDLRSFFRAAPTPQTLRVFPYGGAEEASPAKTIDLRGYVASREYAKRQESVKINVGGKIREIHRTTAERIPLVAALMRFPREGELPIFIDATPRVFDVLVEMARGRSIKYLDSLEPSLKQLTLEYAEYAGLPQLQQAPFCFCLTAIHPANKNAINLFASLEENGSAYTTGIRAQWNTVLGDTQIPSSLKSYWEIEVVKLGASNADFMVGVSNQSFNAMANPLDTGNTGWGLSYQHSGQVHLRTNGTNQATFTTDMFGIKECSRIGVMFDAERGSLMFFLDGNFKMSHPLSLKGQILFPSLSVFGETQLKIVTGLVPPS